MADDGGNSQSPQPLMDQRLRTSSGVCGSSSEGSRKYTYSGGSYVPPPERQRRPNGKLVLRIQTDPYQTGFRRVWRDGKKRRVEDCLNSFICGLINAAKTYRDERLERERWEREREGERRRREGAERLQRQRERLVSDLNSRIEDWHTASLIRQFADAVAGDARQQLGGIDPESDLSLWLKWARQRADHLNANAIRTILQPRPAPKDPSWWSPYGGEDDKVDFRVLLDVQAE